MGALVIAMGRNQDTLKRLNGTFGPSGRLTTITMTGDLEGDISALRTASPTGFSAFLDLSPPAAAGNTYFHAALSLLKHGGRAALMGGMQGEMMIPADAVVHRNLRLYGKWMYSREQAIRCIQVAEAGVLALGEKAGVMTEGGYGLEEIEEAVKMAGEESRWGLQVVVEPGKGMGE